MRNITLAFCLLITAISIAQTKQFVRSLGKTKADRIDSTIECWCIHPKGYLTVGYYKFTATDTFLVFKIWDGKKWETIKELPCAYNKKRNSTKCAYSKDSLLYVATNYYEGGRLKTGFFFLSKSSPITPLAEFRSNNRGEVIIADMKLISDSFLVVFGRFDSTWSFQKKWQENHNIAQFEYEKLTDNWGTSVHVQNAIRNIPINLPVATNNDTTLIIANNNQSIYSYIFHQSFQEITKSTGTKATYSGVYSIGNNWLVTLPNSDTILYYNGIELISIKLNRKISSNVSVTATDKGIFITEDFERRIVISKLDIEKKSLKEIFATGQISPEIPKSALINSKNTIYYSFNIPLRSFDTTYFKIVQLDPEAVKLIKAYVFKDLNRNYIMDGADHLITGDLILLNRTLGYQIKSSTGIFEDRIVNVLNAEYELIKFSPNECLKLPFTGALRSKTEKGENDDLYFPVQEVNTKINLAIKSWGTATARLLDTIPLSIKINVNDCDVKPKQATIKVTLDSNTQLINSFPPYNNKTNNILTYDLKNITNSKAEMIKLNVVYSNTDYKINDYVKHKVEITTAVVGNSTHNTDSIIQKMVYSHDPNAKYSIPQGTIKSNINSIRYYIQFQNEGNDVARRVTVIDTLDTRIPVYEFQMVGASHAYTVTLTNNVVTWVFDNINLVPKSVNDAASQGYVVFDAHIISDVMVGDSIRNKAYIYFDFNEPIITNLSIINRIDDLPKIDESPFTFRVFPNPATATVTIENKINVYQDIKIYNMLGQEIEDIMLNPIGKTIRSVSVWPKGMYFIRSSKGEFQKFLVH